MEWFDRENSRWRFIKWKFIHLIIQISGNNCLSMCLPNPVFHNQLSILEPYIRSALNILLQRILLSVHSVIKSLFIFSVNISKTEYFFLYDYLIAQTKQCHYLLQPWIHSHLMELPYCYWYWHCTWICHSNKTMPPSHSLQHIPLYHDNWSKKTNKICMWPIPIHKMI